MFTMTNLEKTSAAKKKKKKSVQRIWKISLKNKVTGFDLYLTFLSICGYK